MDVSELIDILSVLPPTAPVLISNALISDQVWRYEIAASSISVDGPYVVIQAGEAR